MVVSVVVDIDVIEGLIAAGKLHRNHDEDRTEIASAIGIFLRQQLVRVTRDANAISDPVQMTSPNEEERRASPSHVQEFPRHHARPDAAADR
jgi:hypothetical protein